MKRRYRALEKHIHSGFSAVEILISVVIMGILLSVALIALTAAQKDSKKKACEANMSALFQAEEAYRVRNRSYTSTLSNLSTFLGSVPACPVGASAYTGTITGSGASQTIKITCPNSGAHVTGQTYSTSDGVTFVSP